LAVSMVGLLACVAAVYLDVRSVALKAVRMVYVKVASLVYTLVEK
jgi:hypothetical protein